MLATSAGSGKSSWTYRRLGPAAGSTCTTPELSAGARPPRTPASVTSSRLTDSSPPPRGARGPAAPAFPAPPGPRRPAKPPTCRDARAAGAGARPASGLCSARTAADGL